MTTRLRQMIGQTVVAKIPAIDPDDLVLVKLLEIEPVGVWVESEDYNQTMLRQFKMPTSTTTLLLFVPFSEIEFLVTSINSVSLSLRALGLAE